jgi:hypothetical protein
MVNRAAGLGVLHDAFHTLRADDVFRTPHRCKRSHQLASFATNYADLILGYDDIDSVLHERSTTETDPIA